MFKISSIEVVSIDKVLTTSLMIQEHLKPSDLSFVFRLQVNSASRPSIYLTFFMVLIVFGVLPVCLTRVS